MMFANEIPLWLKPDEYIKEYCPYGRPGDLLWVKENYAYPIEYNDRKPSQVGEHVTVFYEANTEKDWDLQPNGEMVGKWRPSLFMPRLACRITIEIVALRLELLQEITGEGIMAEGCDFPDAKSSSHRSERFDPWIRLWDSLNAKRGHGWDKNEWVWVRTFKVVGR